MAVATTTMLPHTDPTSPSNVQNTNAFSTSNTPYQLHQQISAAPQNATINTPMFSQQEVLRFIQAAVQATQRQQQAGASSASQPPQPNISMLPEERVMKPRVHMYASHYDSSSRTPSSKNGMGTMITTLELPGLRKSDISITARPNGELIVSGERRPQHHTYLGNLMDMELETAMKDTGRTVFNELKFGRFQRTFRLPDGTDPSTISASMEDGMLIISWPVPASVAQQLQMQQSTQISSSDSNQQMAVDQAVAASG